MQRVRIELADLASADNLALAAWKAARGKRQRPEVRRFCAHFDDSIARLRRDILAGVVPYGEYRSFLIHDPKQRLIHAACFADRVLHHAIMNLAGPVFERTLVPSTYACRPGLGVHRAIRQVQAELRRFAWFVKVDVDAYFPSIDHAILERLLARRFKGADFLALLGRIIAACPAAPRRGLPIGSLTSQHFANHYLDGADRFLLAHPLVRAHVRYMDDILCWGDDRQSVRQVAGELREWLQRERHLTLKANVQINRSERGVSYCGARVLRGSLRLTPRKQARYRHGCQRWEAAWLAGVIDEAALQRGYAAVLAPTLHCDSLSWRKRHLELHPSRYSEQ
ncbi:MAG: reverse transcriptase domain-containing protein [Accumulibacter sp.]|jgi:RNA-directed DNA polymerase|uniref:reverse transcriptase domain-containing protein n=1 Tax=Accumulibacter sp. TaxID=2053492 RepID=UPI002FC325B7